MLIAVPIQPLVETEEVEARVKEITLFRPDAVTPAAIIVVFGARDNNGVWVPGVDKNVSSQGDEAYAIQEVFLNAVVQTSAAASLYGVAGMTVKEAAKKIATVAEEAEAAAEDFASGEPPEQENTEGEDVENN